jgi:hypothetical protein
MDSLTTEERIQLAIKAIQLGTSQRNATDTFNVPRTTLRNRLGGMQQNKILKQYMQRLTLEEEGAICCVLQQMDI